MAQAFPLPLPDWPVRLRAQGRSMTWLAQQVGVSRTYLQDVAADRKHASPELLRRISDALSSPPERLAVVREYIDERAHWRDVHDKAIALAAAIAVALGDDDR